MKFATGKLRQASFHPAFKLYDVLEFQNESHFTELLSFLLKNEIFKASIFYQHKIIKQSTL